MKHELKNPFLSKYRSYFELAFLTYLGGKDYILQQLVKHEGEEATHYTKRLDLAHNINIIDKIINILTSFILGGVERKIELDDEVRDEYETTIDLEQSLDEFLERKVAEYLLMDNAFTLVDSDGTRAYCHDLNYLDLYDYAKDMGKLKHIDLLMGEQVVRITEETIQYASIEDYFETKGGPKFTRTEPNPLGEIPFVKINAKMDVRTAYFRDAVYDQKAVFNHYNNISQQLLDTGNLLLAVPGTAGTGKGTKVDMQKSRVIFYMPSSPALPHYISPDTSHLDFYLKYIMHIIEQLLNSLNIYRENNDSQASGLSKSYDYSIMAQLLVKVAGKMERFELSMWDMIGKYDPRVKTEKIEVKYPRNFDLKTLAQQLDNALKVTAMQISDTLTKEIEKGIAAKYVENPETLDQIFKEIDEKNYAVTVNDELDNIDKQL